MDQNNEKQATNLIDKAILKTMLEIAPIAKNRTNSMQNFKYRGIDDVYQGLQHIMANNGLYSTSKIIDVNYSTHTKKDGGLAFMIKGTVEYTLHHESGQTVSSQVLTSGMGSDDKDAFKAMSGAHKYFLLQLFMIPTEEPKDPEYETLVVGDGPSKVSTESVNPSVEKANKMKKDSRELLSLKEIMNMFEDIKPYGEKENPPIILSDIRPRLIKASGDKKELLSIYDECMEKINKWKLVNDDK
jgi:hypothetical protein